MQIASGENREPSSHAGPRPKTSLIAVGALIFSIAGVLTGVSSVLLERLPGHVASTSLLLLALGLILGVAGSAHVELSRGRVGGKKLASAAIIVSSLALVGGAFLYVAWLAAMAGRR